MALHVEPGLGIIFYRDTDYLPVEPVTDLFASLRVLLAISVAVNASTDPQVGVLGGSRANNLPALAAGLVASVSF